MTPDPVRIFAFCQLSYKTRRTLREGDVHHVAYKRAWFRRSLRKLCLTVNVAIGGRHQEVRVGPFYGMIGLKTLHS